ncbi:hypothetical protein QYM36_005602 [Artemia franciscana]|uniref:A-kinase anchor protein 13 n=1 Tax=Artemia franciscana TaxID=6661 RepID=A0AA88I1F7_ARTSF|nr:hypothetical protein QYM36_005602 [Artemia franciscana]
MEKHQSSYSGDEKFDDDSDEDIILDYISNSSCAGDQNCNTEMAVKGEPIPTISITQHVSPAAGKASLVLEDNLKELRNIQNAVKRMKEANLHTLQLQLRFRNMKPSISKSCPSLVPDAENNLEYMDSPSPPSSGHTSSENKDEVDSVRRKWENEHPKTEQKKQRSASLSSLETDGEESGGAATIPPSGDLVDGWCSRWHGKISAFSSGQTSPVAWIGTTGDRTYLELGEITRGQNLAGTRNSFLHKSISTPSIIAVNDVTAVDSGDTARSGISGPKSLVRTAPSGESETEDESPLAAYLHHQQLHDPSFNDDESSGKRRKRGSIFFRKRKDKEKKKGSFHHFVSVSHSNSQIVTCDVCTKALNNKSALHCDNCLVNVHENCREQVADCSKFKIPKASNLAKLSQPPKLSTSMLSVTNSFSTSALMTNVSASQTPSLLRRTSMSNFSYSSNTLAKNEICQSSGPLTFTLTSRGARRLSGFSQWKRVATKLGVNKVISEEKYNEAPAGNADETSSVNILSLNSASSESLPEVVDSSNDLEIDPELGILDEESEAWINKVDKTVPQGLTQKEIKRQEHIYEFIMTEKHHCVTLRVMQKIFSEGMQRDLNYSKELVDRLFPRLDDLIEYHSGFLKRLRIRQREQDIVSTLEDILREQFSGTCGDQLRSIYGEFCSRHKEAVSLYKDILKADRKFQAFVRTCSQNPLCKKKGIPECILFVTQRITKYPLLVDPLIKTSRDKPEENFKLQQVMQLIKDIIIDVNAQVAEKEREERLLDIYNKIDAKSATAYKGTKFKKSDLLSGNRKLMFEGVAVLSNARGKVQVATVVVLSDVIFFLLENNQKFHFFAQDGKPGVISLEKLLVRDKAGFDSRGIYLISSDLLEPEIYELQIQLPRDKKNWIDSIRLAIERRREQEEVNKLIAESEEERKVQEARTVRIRQVVSALRNKDVDLAVILEEKVRLLGDLVEVANPNPLDDSSSPIQEPIRYTHLVGDNVDNHVMRETLLTTLKEATKLASALYSTGCTSLSRSVSSAGERTSEAYQNPVLPRRAETFGGFDYPAKEVALPLPAIKARKKLSDVNAVAISSIDFSVANDPEDVSQIASEILSRQQLVRKIWSQISLRNLTGLV